MPDNNLDDATAQYLRALRSAGVRRGERRRHPRYRCAGNVQLRTQGDTGCTSGTFTDISRSGCYVDVQATFPPGTKMYLSLEFHECHVHTNAVVRVTYPFVGMGLEFIEMTDANVAKLERMLGVLAGTAQPGSEHARMKPGRFVMELRPITDTAAAIDAVIRRFQESDHLSREEFVALIRDSQSRSNL